MTSPARMAMVWDPPGVDINTPEQWPLAKGEVKHVGQAVAVVVAHDRGTAVDAAELVMVDYETLPAVVDPEKALEDGSPLVHEAFGTNRTHDWGIAGGDADQALSDAEVVVERRIVNHRTSGAPIEPRSSIAEPQGDGVTLYSSTQVPHITRFVLSGVLGMSEDKIHVIAPDVGGGFGAKLQVYGEEALIVALARRLHRPVKWTETRSEHMTTSHHGRDQITTVTFGATRDGKVNALKVHTLADLGAYLRPAHAVHPRARLPGGERVLRHPERQARASPASSPTSSRPTPSAAPGGPRSPTGSRS